MMAIQHNHQVTILDSGKMPRGRKKRFQNYLRRQQEVPSVEEIASWVEAAFKGKWVVVKVTQEGTYQRHWVYLKFKTKNWIELAVDHEWNFCIFQV